MKIHAGEIDKYKKTYSLFLGEEEWKTVHLSIFGGNPKFGDVHSLDELEEKFALLEYKGAKGFVLRRLALKNYHSAELAAALYARGVNESIASQVLNEFAAQGYLNDEAWVASFVQAMRLQRFGFKSILLKLRRRGVFDTATLAAVHAMQEAESPLEDERVSIEKLLNSRYKNRDFSQRKERDKVIAALIRKGYQLDDIFAVLKAKRIQPD